MQPLGIGIAGAGLLGRLLAWRLASAGHRVAVFDPAEGPQERGAAGWTAAGLLSPIAELECADARVAALGWRSITLWRAWTDELAQSGAPVHFSANGSLLLAHPGDRAIAQRVLQVLAAKAPDCTPEPLDAAAVRAMEPALAHGLLTWLLPGEAHIHTVQAMLALAAAATALGVEWRWNHRAQHVAAARIDSFRFDHVFDVRGAGARPALPVRGVRGEILSLHAPGVPLNRPLRLLHARHRVYLVPRAGGELVVGASEIESEDRSPVSVRSTVELLSAAWSVIPELAEARVVRSETNLRPALPDNLPLCQSEPGLTRINGLFRHGWLIAPALVEDACAELGVSEQRATENA